MRPAITHGGRACPRVLWRLERARSFHLDRHIWAAASLGRDRHVLITVDPAPDEVTVADELAEREQPLTDSMSDGRATGVTAARDARGRRAAAQ